MRFTGTAHEERTEGPAAAEALPALRRWVPPSDSRRRAAAIPPARRGALPPSRAEPRGCREPPFSQRAAPERFPQRGSVRKVRGAVSCQAAAAHTEQWAGSPRGVGALLSTSGAARDPPARRADGRGSGRRAGRRCHGDGRVSLARSGAAEGKNGFVISAEARSHGPSTAWGCALTYSYAWSGA